MPLLRINNISYKPQSKTYLDRRLNEFVLAKISLDLQENEVTAVIGESGGGKTLLAKIIAGLIGPDEGTIELNIETDSKISPVQILFQNSSELINPYRLVKDFLLYPSNSTEDVDYYLELLGLPANILAKKTGNLSGGERQRVALARVLLTRPKVLILDEPFSAQDIASQVAIKSILSELKSKMNLCMVIVSHTFGILEGLADKIVILRNGRIIEQGKYSDIVNSPCDAYTAFLLKAADYKLTKEETIEKRIINQE